MNFYAVNAKIFAMRSKLLKRKDYEYLCSLKTVDEVGVFIAEQPFYSFLMPAAENGGTHRGALEQMLAPVIYYAYENIGCFFYEKKYRFFMDRLFERHPHTFIKLLMCGIRDKNPHTAVFELSAFINKYIRTDAHKLASADNLETFVDSLKKAPFYPMITAAYEENKSIFAIETQLDLYYYLRLKKFAGSLGKKSKAAMDKLTGEEIDIRNIIWMYRLKFFFGINDARIYTYLIPIHYRLKPSDIRQLAECAHEDLFTEKIQSTAYKNIFGDFTKPERKFDLHMQKLLAQTAGKCRDTPACAVSFLFDLEIEIKNLTTVIEGVRYGLAAGSILSQLIC
ncbi:MAG: V-type ATPase subunit [Defluviitaleaceae bacterium]|nr:V-type ATPase subunit [Defluviitaleaceae bacterium]